MKLYLIILFVFLIACESVPLYEQKYNMAVNTWKQGNRNEAITLLQEALQENPDFYEGRLELGSYYFQQKKYKEAAAQYEAAVEIAPQDPNPWILAGESYLELARSIEYTDIEERSQKFLTGQNKFSNALRLDGISKEDKFRATLGKGICQLYRTLKEDAREYIGDALRMKPNDVVAQFYNAVMLEQQLGPNKKSLEKYKEVLEKEEKKRNNSEGAEPLHLEALQNIGDSFCKLNLTSSAYDYYKDFLNYGGKNKNIQEFVSTENNRRQAEESRRQAEEVKNNKVEETVMICPACERFGKKGQTVCEFDGTDLIIFQDKK